MPEANVLYSVTGVVVVGLIAWVAMVLKSAKEPWIRPAPAAGELPSEEAAPAPSEAEAKKDDDAKSDAKKDPNALDADDTARATPVALSEGRTKAAEEAKTEEEAAKEDEENEKKA